MSKTLSRLRSATGYPLLVRAGRGLVPTPRAIEIRDRVHALASDVREVLGPQTGAVDLTAMDRTFTIRASEEFVELFSVRLVAALTAEARHIRLRFAPKPEKDAVSLRAGEIQPSISATRVLDVIGRQALQSRRRP